MPRVIESYVHGDRIGVLVELSCLGDATAKTDEFKRLAKDIAMHIAASNPAVVYPEDLKKVVGIRHDHLRAESLLEQPFVKNPDVRVSERISEVNKELGEKIRVKRFVRYDTEET